jgi:hypothetical protein
MIAVGGGPNILGPVNRTLRVRSEIVNFTFKELVTLRRLV